MNPAAREGQGPSRCMAPPLWDFRLLFSQFRVNSVLMRLKDNQCCSVLYEPHEVLRERVLRSKHVSSSGNCWRQDIREEQDMLILQVVVGPVPTVPSPPARRMWKVFCGLAKIRASTLLLAPMRSWVPRSQERSNKLPPPPPQLTEYQGRSNPSIDLKFLQSLGTRQCSKF